MFKPNLFLNLNHYTCPLEKKVLIITYYWPPSGGSGVQRWLKFVKYLPHFGWEPIVFTPENPSFSIRDESLLNDIPSKVEVIRFPIWEPYEIFLKLSGSNKGSLKPTELVSKNKRSLFQSFATWIRGNIFVPDPRVFWVKPSVNFLHDFILQNKIKTIITTGPPHSVHLIGYWLKKKNSSLRWLADFRDPWSQWGFLDSIKAGSFARRLHKRFESKVLSSATKIITITPFYVRQFKSLAQRHVDFLPNGFDEDDFKNLVHTRNDKFLIRHVGTINEKCDPRPFMTALREVMIASEGFTEHVKIEFIGEVHPDFKSFVTHDEKLSSVTSFTGNIPHKQLLSKYGESSLLLLVLHGYKDAEGFMPGKLFEYMATGIPVLGIGPANGDASDLLRETKAGEMFDAANLSGIKNFLIMNFDRWNGHNDVFHIDTAVNNYSRKELARRLAELL